MSGTCTADTIIDNLYMKKIELLHFTVTNILSTAQNFEQFSRFFCRAVDILKKSVELTLTPPQSLSSSAGQ